MFGIKPKAPSFEKTFESVFGMSIIAFCKGDTNNATYLTNGINNNSSDQVTNVLNRLDQNNPITRQLIGQVQYKLGLH